MFYRQALIIPTTKNVLAYIIFSFPIVCVCFYLALVPGESLVDSSSWQPRPVLCMSPFHWTLHGKLKWQSLHPPVKLKYKKQWQLFKIKSSNTYCTVHFTYGLLKCICSYNVNTSVNNCKNPDWVRKWQEQLLKENNYRLNFMHALIIIKTTHHQAVKPMVLWL